MVFSLFFQVGRDTLGELLGYCLFDASDAVFRVGVRTEEFRRGVPFAGFGQDVHHFDCGPRVVAGFGRKTHAQLVGLEFVLATESQIDELSRGHRQCHALATARVIRVRSGNDRGSAESLRQFLFGQMLGAVATDDMADLVPQHGRDLPFGFQPIEQAGCDKHLAAGQHKGVDRAVVAA